MPTTSRGSLSSFTFRLFKFNLIRSSLGWSRFVSGLNWIGPALAGDAWIAVHLTGRTWADLKVREWVGSVAKHLAGGWPWDSRGAEFRCFDDWRNSFKMFLVVVDALAWGSRPSAIRDARRMQVSKNTALLKIRVYSAYTLNHAQF